MFINTNDLLPIPPNLTFKSRIPLYRILKNILICFVFLGGLYMIVDKISDHLIHNIEKSIVYKECDRDTDVLGHNQFREHILNAEKLTTRTKLDENTFNLLKNDMVNMRDQLLKLWKVYLCKLNSINAEPNKCFLPEIDNKIETVIMKSNSVDTKIKKALDKYDADKLAVYDYAAEYAGAEIISTPDTIPYPTNKILQIFGFFRLFYSSSPTEIIKPSTMPGNCFQFYGSKARIIIKLGKKINIASVSMEHSPLVQNISDAPRDFKVYSLNDAKTVKTLLGTFTYNNEGEAIQNFPLNNPLFWNTEFEYIELEVLNNYGNPLYTSIYRFRVHARKKDD